MIKEIINHGHKFSKYNNQPAPRNFSKISSRLNNWVFQWKAKVLKPICYSLYIFLEACLVLTLKMKWSMYSSWSWVHIISGLLLYLLLQVLHRKLGDHQLWETSERRSHFTDYTMNNRFLDAIASQEYCVSVNQFLS